jgi:hypothetical protein
MANSNPKRNDEMEPHEILSAGIPRGKARILANTLGLSESSVLKWQREPISDENPQATGSLNPIERTDRIFDFLLIYCPEMAAVLASRYQVKLDAFHTRLIREPLTEMEWRMKIAKGLRENAESIAAIIEGAPADVVRKEWEEAKLEIEEMVRRREAGEFQHNS